MLRIKNEGRGKMPSFDIVSEVDLQEARNAVVTRAAKWSPVLTSVMLKPHLAERRQQNHQSVERVRFPGQSLLDILRAKLLKRGIEGSSLVYRKISFIAVKPGLWKRN